MASCVESQSVAWVYNSRYLDEGYRTAYAPRQ